MLAHKSRIACTTSGSGRVAVRAAGKGFSTSTGKQKKSEGTGGGGQRKRHGKGKEGRKHIDSMNGGPQPRSVTGDTGDTARPQQDGAQAPTPIAAAAEEPFNPVEEQAFEKRLIELRREGQKMRKEQTEKVPSDLLASAAAYENPPGILDSIQRDGTQASISNDTTKRVPVIIGSVVIAALLIAGALGLDQGGSSSRSRAELSSEERKEIQSQMNAFEAELARDPGNLDALEGSAVSAVRLGEFKDGEVRLSRLVGARPDNTQAWRLLSETRRAMKDTRGAAEAAERAYELDPSDLSLSRIYALSLVEDGRPEAAAAAVAQMGLSTGEGKGLTELEAQLLLAKVYLKWPGHTAQAAEIYENVIADNPEDFRGFLAKGMLLRSQGRQADADRAFLRARYLAPEGMRGAVERISGSKD